MPNVLFTVTDFKFPADIKDKFAAFRLAVSLRYVKTDGTLAVVRDFIPGAGNEDYWECEKGNKGKANYVRHPTLPQIDTTKVGVPRREVLFSGLEFQSLDRVSVKIYDVEKDGKWDQILTTGLKLAFGVGLEILSSGTAITVGNVLTQLKKHKDAERSEVEKQFDELIDARLKQNKTRLLWEHSSDIEGITSGDPIAVTGNSEIGVFVVGFSSKLK